MNLLDKDGVYTIEVALSGGSGKASITTPARLTVVNGKMTLEVEWSSNKYDLMIVGGENYLPVSTEGNSVFMIPVSSVDSPLAVQAETLAMSEPHLIDYEIIFDTSSVKGNGESGSSLPLIIGASIVIICAAVAAVMISRKKGKKKDA